MRADRVEHRTAASALLAREMQEKKMRPSASCAIVSESRLLKCSRKWFRSSVGILVGLPQARWDLRRALKSQRIQYWLGSRTLQFLHGSLVTSIVATCTNLWRLSPTFVGYPDGQWAIIGFRADATNKMNYDVVSANTRTPRMCGRWLWQKKRHADLQVVGASRQSGHLQLKMFKKQFRSVGPPPGLK